MVTEATGQQARYNADYQFRRDYNLALKERVMSVLDPILEQDQAPPILREQLEAILLGHYGKILLNETGVRALYEADLLVEIASGNRQLDDPGWRHIAEKPNILGQPHRIHSYFLRLPEGVQGNRSVANVGLTLRAMEILDYRLDFTRWLLSRG